jgi:hypothetical protein
MTIDPTESDERISLESSRRKSRSSIRQPSSSVGRRSTTGNPGSLSCVYFFGLTVAPGNVRRRARGWRQARGSASSGRCCRSCHLGDPIPSMGFSSNFLACYYPLPAVERENVRSGLSASVVEDDGGDRHAQARVDPVPAGRRPASAKLARDTRSYLSFSASNHKEWPRVRDDRLRL